MGILRKRVRVVVALTATVAAHMARKSAARKARKPKEPIAIWWVAGHCTDGSCKADDNHKLAQGHVNRPVFLCQICRLCALHCLGHRGILDGLRAVLTVHKYD